MTAEKPDEWDQHIDPILFAYMQVSISIWITSNTQELYECHGRYYMVVYIYVTCVMLFTTYRTSQQASSKYTPFELLYKRKPRLPMEISTLPQGVDEDEAGVHEVRAEDLDAHMQAMIEWAVEVNAKAKSNIEKAQEKQKKQFDAKHKPPTF